MPLDVTVEIKGIDQVRRELDRIDKRISNTAPFWRSIAIPIIKNKLRDIFLQEGPGWAPLAQSTERSRRYPGLPILEQTGALQASLVDHPIVQVSGDKLLYGTNNPYAPFHERGTSRMPARPFLHPAFQEAISEIQNQFVGYIGSQIRGRL